MSPNLAKLRIAIALALIGGAAHAADVTVQPAINSGFVVTNAAGTSEVLRANEGGSVLLPSLPNTTTTQATALCFGAGGLLGPCAGSGGGFTLPYSASQNYLGNLFDVTNTQAGSPGVALRGETQSSSVADPTAAGVLGVASGPGGSGGVFLATLNFGGAYGVYAQSIAAGAAIYANAAGGGVAVKARAASSTAIDAMSQGGSAGVFDSQNTLGPVLVVNAQVTSSGTNLAVFQNNGANVARIDPSGKGFFNGGTQNSGADLAEFVPTAGSEPQPGDVVEIDPTQPDRFRLAAEAGTTRVAGVISTKPGVTLNAQTPAETPTEGPALALVGRVPVKATNANGAIHIGDLLVASSLSGHAMRASVSAAPGSVIGKALADFDATDGTLPMLVWGR